MDASFDLVDFEAPSEGVSETNAQLASHLRALIASHPDTRGFLVLSHLALPDTPPTAIDLLFFTIPISQIERPFARIMTDDRDVRVMKVDSANGDVDALLRGVQGGLREWRVGEPVVDENAEQEILFALGSGGDALCKRVADNLGLMLVSWNAIDGSVTDPDVSIAEDEDGGDEVMDASNVHIAVKEAVTAPRNTPDPSACVETEEPAIVTEHSGPDAEGSSVDPNPLESVIQEVPDLNSPPERISLLEPDFASPESSREITGAAPSVTLTKKVTFCESVPSDMAVAPSQRHGQLRPVRMALFFLIVVLVTSFTLYLTA